MFPKHNGSVPATQARITRRIHDRIALRVATEEAASALAHACGWDWPELRGCAFTPGTNIAEARATTREHVRFMAQVAVGAFMRYLEHGGTVEMEEAVVANSLAQERASHTRTLADMVLERRAQIRAMPDRSQHGTAGDPPAGSNLRPSETLRPSAKEDA